MRERDRVMGQRISGEKTVRVAKAAVVGAVVEGGREYIGQRGKIKPHVPLEEKTLKRYAQREVVIFQKVDKGKVAEAALKGAITSGFAEATRPEVKRKSVNLPLAA